MSDQLIHCQSRGAGPIRCSLHSSVRSSQYRLLDLAGCLTRFSFLKTSRSPETVESLFIAWRLTGDARYRTYGWNIFQAIEKHCRVDSGGYASIFNVDALPVEYEDKMETFLMVRRFQNLTLTMDCLFTTGNALQSETLKYLYLLFEDSSVLPLSSTFHHLLSPLQCSLRLVPR